MYFKQYLLFFFLLFYFCSYLSAENEQLAFKVTIGQDIVNSKSELVLAQGKQTISVVLTEERKNHIFYGEETPQGFSGGHDWDSYFEKYIKDDPHADVFFDVNLFAYVVKSKKGDSLLEIIAKLKAKTALPHYHSLFPSEFLQKEGIILEAFKKAMLEKIILNKSSIDFDNGTFFTDFKSDHNKLFKVAGRFRQVGSTFYIETFYPDLSWYYRIDFSHNDEPFKRSRFIKYIPFIKKGVLYPRWVRNAHNKEMPALNEDNAFLPEPLENIAIFAEDTKNFDIKSEELIEEEKIDSLLRSILVENTDLSRVDFFTLVFSSPVGSIEYEKEFNDLLAFLRITMGFKAGLKIINLRSLKIAFNKYAQNCSRIYAFSISPKDLILKRNMSYSCGTRNAAPLYALNEAFKFYTMSRVALSIDVGDVPRPGEAIAILERVAERVHDNLLKRLLDSNEYLSKIILDMRFYKSVLMRKCVRESGGASESYFALRVLLRKNLSSESYFAEDLQHRLSFGIKPTHPDMLVDILPKTKTRVR